jgi:hypothetical protein
MSCKDWAANTRVTTRQKSAYAMIESNQRLRTALEMPVEGGSWPHKRKEEDTRTCSLG